MSYDLPGVKATAEATSPVSTSKHNLISPSSQLLRARLTKARLFYTIAPRRDTEMEGRDSGDGSPAPFIPAAGLLSNNLLLTPNRLRL